jgi:hypothetical protein
MFSNHKLLERSCQPTLLISSMDLFGLHISTPATVDQGACTHVMCELQTLDARGVCIKDLNMDVVEKLHI